MGLSPPLSIPLRLLLFLSASLLLSLPLCFGHATPATGFAVVNIENPVFEFSPSPLSAHASPDSKDALFCERLRVVGRSRLMLGSYASALHVMLVPSVVIPERMYSKILVCFHRNASLGLCICEQHEWKAVQKGSWTSTMSPFADRYVDLKTVGKVPGTVMLNVKEEIHLWRLSCLALGAALFFIAPTVSSWVPFYYSTFMVIGVFLFILFLLFQGLKLLPTGRKSGLYFLISGSIAGAGSYLYYHFTMLVNSVLVSFGLSEDMHHLVSIFLLFGIILMGAGLGYWMVRNYIISEDGTVNIGTAIFVKWAMRFISGVFFWQSTLDISLAVAAFISWCGICSLVGSSNWRDLVDGSINESPWLWKVSNGTVKRNRAEFLSRSPKMGDHGTVWNNPKNASPWFDSPIKGVVSSLNCQGSRTGKDYYSTFHKIGKRKKFSEKEWAESKRESTRLALAELSASQGFLSWMIDNAKRIQVLPDDSLDESIKSESDSTEEVAVQSGNRLNPFNMR